MPGRLKECEEEDCSKLTLTLLMSFKYLTTLGHELNQFTSLQFKNLEISIEKKAKKDKFIKSFKIQ